MNRPLKIAIPAAMAVVLASATALPASASYLGYGNGDPGNWDLWQEQNGGRPVPDDTPVYDNHYQRHHSYSYYNSYDPFADHHASRHAHRQAPKHSS